MADGDEFFRGEPSAAASTIGYAVTVATTAANDTDPVYVTLDQDDEPRSRIRVQWREQGTARPARGNKGAIIFLDLGEPWLLW